MTTDNERDSELYGVYYIDGSGDEQFVHAYQSDHYGLDDVYMLFGLGRLEPNADEDITIALTGSEAGKLKTMAYAQSFDHPEGFIAMCLDIHAFVADRGEGPFVFRGDT